MQRIACGVFVLLVGAGGTSVEAGGNANGLRQRLEKEIAPQLVSVIAVLGRGETEKAIDRFERLAGRRFKTGKTPFEKNERETWMKTFAVFRKQKADFESVDLIGIQQVSSQAYKVSLIGNGSLGPALFQCRLYEYRGTIRLATVRFETNWDRIDFMTSNLQERLSIRFAISAQTAKGKAKSPRR